VGRRCALHQGQNRKRSRSIHGLCPFDVDGLRTACRSRAFDADAVGNDRRYFRSRAPVESCQMPNDALSMRVTAERPSMMLKRPPARLCRRSLAPGQRVRAAVEAISRHARASGSRGFEHGPLNVNRSQFVSLPVRQVGKQLSHRACFLQRCDNDRERLGPNGLECRFTGHARLKCKHFGGWRELGRKARTIASRVGAIPSNLRQENRV
jgi:hypothetical protein